MGMKCSKCDGEFVDSKALNQHTGAKHAEQSAIQEVSSKALKRMERKEERKAERAQELKTERSGKFLKYGIFVVLIIGIGYWATSSAPSSAPNASAIKHDIAPGTGITQYAGGIPTGPIHWHPHLTIKINGQQQAIPANVGIGATIHQPIHTHDDTGILHMENGNPTAENMKLGFFFTIWGKKFNNGCIFEFCNSGDKKIKFTVNEKENADFENYFMRDGDKMVIEYG